MAANGAEARSGTKSSIIVSRGRQQRDLEQRQADKKERERLAGEIMQVYDKDESGGLSKAQLLPMLKDCSMQSTGLKGEAQPGPEDIEFLFKLFDVDGSDGVIARDATLRIIAAWAEFVKEKKGILEAIEKFNIDTSGLTDVEELQSILDGLKQQEQLVQVQPEVTEWVFKQADINQKGALSVMELTRALVAFDMWVAGFTQCSVAPEMMAVIDKDPALNEPQTGSSTCCVVC